MVSQASSASKQMGRFTSKPWEFMGICRPKFAKVYAIKMAKIDSVWLP
jgi:hypothetical protein